MREMTSLNLRGAASASPEPLASWYAPGLTDGLGDRLLMFDNTAGPSLELLRFRPDLALAPGFEAALRDQVKRLARFQHANFARIRAVQRLEPDGDLALVSHHTPGKRLSEVLHRTRGTALATALIRQLAPALAEFQRSHPGASHGLLHPNRIVVSPDASLTIIEHAIGPAIDSLRLSTAQLAAAGIAVPSASALSTPRLDAATDWYQLGIVAASVLLGRPVSVEELPGVAAMLEQMDERQDGASALAPPVRKWLGRALRFGSDAIDSADAGGAAVNELLRDTQGSPSRRLVSVGATPAAPEDEPTVILRRPQEPSVIEARAVEPAPVAVPDPPPAPMPAPAPSPAQREPEPRPSVIPFPSEVANTRERVSREAAIMPVAYEDPWFPPEAPPPPQPEVRDRNLSQFEREVLAGRVQDAPKPAAARASSPSARLFASRTVQVITAIAVLEAGVIGLLVHRAWFASPAFSVAQVSEGEQSVVAPGAPGAMQLSFGSDSRWVRITSVPGSTSGKASAAGGLRVLSPVPVKIVEGSKTIGSAPGNDLDLSPGRHELRLVNDALGVSVPQTIEAAAGQTIVVHLAPAPGTLTVVAPVGSEISVNGELAGRAPIDPLTLVPGDYQVVVKHPKVANERQRVTVKAGAHAEVAAKGK